MSIRDTIGYPICRTNGLGFRPRLSCWCGTKGVPDPSLSGTSPPTYPLGTQRSGRYLTRGAYVRPTTRHSTLDTRHSTTRPLDHSTTTVRVRVPSLGRQTERAGAAAGVVAASCGRWTCSKSNGGVRYHGSNPIQSHPGTDRPSAPRCPVPSRREPVCCVCTGDLTWGHLMRLVVGLVIRHVAVL